MTTSRLAILLAVLLGGLSTAFMLPKQLGFMPVGINVELPESLGEWWGHPVEVTQHERDVLGHDTEFARKEYSNGRGDGILASVVLAGQDMMTSIHRPERCLRAQGWEFYPGGNRVIDIPGRGKLPVVRLKNHKLERLKDGSTIPVENICYYWFAGNVDVTESHLARVRIDTRDRLFSGYAQRWAMLMISANITANRQKFGRDERGTDELIVRFIQQMAPQLHKDTIKYH
jgi:EpsI family protein